MVDVETAAPTPKKKKLSRLKERRAARVKAAAGGGGGSDGAECQAPVKGRHVLIGRNLLVYLAEEEQADVNVSNLLGFWNRRGINSFCPTTRKVTSPADKLFLVFIARLYPSRSTGT